MSAFPLQMHSTNTQALHNPYKHACRLSLNIIQTLSELACPPFYKQNPSKEMYCYSPEPTTALSLHLVLYHYFSVLLCITHSPIVDINVDFYD